ncbi:MAG: XRE family transcriptional regulator [Halanaerobium sp.]|nr:MAG: XRE family transcriptional regulator [Halanaerobium sp.]
MEKDTIINFLLKAKKSTYAAKGAEVESSRPQSHDLKYQKDQLLYIDSYLGGEHFAGEEAVWIKETPVWAMNYYGRVLAAGFEGDFLKEALLNVTAEMPYRGPAEYVKDDLKYKCSLKGDFEYFKGYEAIYKKDNKVYECRFHGGIIK